MDGIIMNVNWLAISVGAVLSFGLGWLWYSPKLFGTRWAAAVGVDISDSSVPNPLAMITQAIGTFLLAWIIAVTAVSDALLTAVLIVLTVVFLMVAGGLYTKKSRYALLTEAGYVLIMAVIMTVCQVFF